MRTFKNNPLSYLSRRLVIPVLAALLLLPAASAFAAAPCPNEQLRQESQVDPATGRPYDLNLPDCRAYEMVSPAYLGGDYAGFEAMSGEGNAVEYYDQAGFADAPGRPAGYGYIGDHYIAQREPGGWQTHAISMGQDITSRNLDPFDFSPNLSSAIWFGEPAIGGEATKTGPLSVALENTETDTFALAGVSIETNVSYPRYYGATSDFSEVVIGANNPLLTTLDKSSSTVTVPEVHNPYAFLGVGTATPTLRYIPVYTNKSSGQEEALSTSTTAGAEVASEGSSGVKESGFHAVSESGTVFFTVAPTNPIYLTYNDDDPQKQVFARNVEASTTTDLSEPTATECAACQLDPASTGQTEAVFQGASADGSKVFFSTTQELLAGQTTNNIYEYDFDEPAGKRIVLVSAGSGKPEVQGVVRISDDGSHVYFVAKGVLTTAPNATTGQFAQAGAENLYVFEHDAAHPEGEMKFVTDLCTGPHTSGSLAAYDWQCAGSGSDAGLWADDELPSTQVSSPEGAYLVFASNGDLTPDDTSTVAQLFRYDAQTGALIRVSAGAKTPGGSYPCPLTGDLEEGYDCDGNTNAYPAAIAAPIKEPPRSSQVNLENNGGPTGYARAITDNGSEIVFSTEAALSPADTSGAMQDYEWQAEGADGCEQSGGCVSLISDGVDPAGVRPPASPTTPVSAYVDISANGENIFFGDSEKLVGQDTGSSQEIYDARVEGGFPAPTPPPSCEGEACQGAASALYTPPGPAGSSTQAAGENLATVTATTTTTTTKPKALTKAQKLAEALKACKKNKQKAKRAACEKTARRRYGSKKKTAAKKGKAKK